MDIMCRACLDTNNTLISTDSIMIDNFNSMTNLQATLFDCKPQFFCCNCYECLELFVKFKEKCIESEKTLEDIVSREIQTKESTPDIKESTPDIKESTPDIKESTPDIKESTPDIKESTPDIKESTPDINESTPDIKESTPDIKIEDEIKYSYGEMGLDDNDEVTDNTMIQKPTPTIKKKKTKKINTKAMQKPTPIKTIKKKKTKKRIAKTKAKKNIVKKTKPIINDINVFSCGICTETHEDKVKLNVHIDSHKNDKICKICKEFFTEWVSLLGHRVIHLEQTKKKCHICNKFFLTESGMEYHYRTVHFEGMQTALTCKYCSKLYDNSIKLQRHFERMHKPKPTFKCEHCPKICKTNTALRKHLKVHSDRRDYICDDCGFSCKQAGNLIHHIKRKHTTLCFCTYCQKAFKNAQILADHKPKCTDSFTLCLTCGKKVLKTRLKQHMRVHSDVCKYKCTRCPAAFKAKGSLEAHIDRHEGYKRYECPFCGMKFYTSPSLTRHKRVHTGEKPYKCKKCSKAFTHGNNLKVHMKVHGEFLVKKKSFETETSG